MWWEDKFRVKLTTWCAKSVACGKRAQYNNECFERGLFFFFFWWRNFTRSLNVNIHVKLPRTNVKCIFAKRTNMCAQVCVRWTLRRKSPTATNCISSIARAADIRGAQISVNSVGILNAVSAFIINYDMRWENRNENNGYKAYSQTAFFKWAVWWFPVSATSILALWPTSGNFCRSLLSSARIIRRRNSQKSQFSSLFHIFFSIFNLNTIVFHVERLQSNFVNWNEWSVRRGNERLSV